MSIDSLYNDTHIKLFKILEICKEEYNNYVDYCKQFDLEEDIVEDIDYQIDFDDIDTSEIENKKVEPLGEDFNYKTPFEIGNEKDDFIFTTEHLPSIPFSLLECGERGAGKTYTACQLLSFLSPYFHNVILISKSAYNDMKWSDTFKNLNLPFIKGKNVFEEYSEELIGKYVDKMKKVNKGIRKMTDKYRSLIIFDDIIKDLPKGKRKSRMNDINLNNRHTAISVVILGQCYKMFDPDFRKNCNQILLWRNDNKFEIKAYLDELSGALGKTPKEQTENFMKIYMENTNPIFHDFLYINFKQKDRNKKFSKNWNEYINIDNLLIKNSFIKKEKKEVNVELKEEINLKKEGYLSEEEIFKMLIEEEDNDSDINNGEEN